MSELVGQILTITAAVYIIAAAFVIFNLGVGEAWMNEYLKKEHKRLLNYSLILLIFSFLLLLIDITRGNIGLLVGISYIHLLIQYRVRKRLGKDVKIIIALIVLLIVIAVTSPLYLPKFNL